MSARSGNIESLQRLNRMNRPSKSLVTPPPPKRSNGIARQPNAAPRLASLRYSRHQLVVFALEKAIGWLRNCANTRNQPTLTTVSCNSPIEFPPRGLSYLSEPRPSHGYLFLAFLPFFRSPSACAQAWKLVGTVAEFSLFTFQGNLADSFRSLFPFSRHAVNERDAWLLPSASLERCLL